MWQVCGFRRQRMVLRPKVMTINGLRSRLCMRRGDWADAARAGRKGGGGYQDDAALAMTNGTMAEVMSNAEAIPKRRAGGGA